MFPFCPPCSWVLGMRTRKGFHFLIFVASEKFLGYHTPFSRWLRKPSAMMISSSQVGKWPTEALSLRLWRLIGLKAQKKIQRYLLLRERVKIIIVTQAMRSLPHRACYLQSFPKVSLIDLHFKPQVMFRLLCKTLNHLPKEGYAKPIYLSPCYWTSHLLAQRQSFNQLLWHSY